MIVLKNNAQSILAQSLAPEETTLRVSQGDGALFPLIPLEGHDWFRAALSDNAGNTEYIRVTACHDDSFVVQRAQEDTMARSWPAGTRLQLRMTAKTWEEMAGAEWRRLVEEGGNSLVPLRLDDTTFTLTGDRRQEFMARRAIRFPGPEGEKGEVYYAAAAAVEGNTTIISLEDGPLPHDVAAVEVGVHPAMLPLGLALSDAVDSTSSTTAASSAAVKAAYDRAGKSAPASHSHTAGDVTSGVLSVARGGTGNATGTAADSVKWNGAARTISTAAASGGAANDIWFQYI